MVLPLPQAFLASLEMLAPSRMGRGKMTRVPSPLPLRGPKDGRAPKRALWRAFGRSPNGGGFYA